jgi:preprotein translocase subunit SecA
MGRAILALIQNELRTVVGEIAGAGSPVCAGRAQQQLAARESHIAAREREVEAVEERLRGWTERLRTWEGELQALEQRNRVASSMAPPPNAVRQKVGRNDRCPCRSGLKYKHCHGLADRQAGSA